MDRQLHENEPSRKCVCCGVATPTRSMPACWEHWAMLPMDLRSDLIATYSRGELREYAENLKQAVVTWREVGAWRSRASG
jgi:hypothetical protein